MPPTGEITVLTPARAPFGLRSQIVLGLAVVALFAVMSAGALALWAAGGGLREQREASTTSLTAAAAAAAAAVINPDRPLGDAANAAALQAIIHKLGDKSEIDEVTIFAPDRAVIFARPAPPVATDDGTLLTAVLSGIPPVLNYRTRPGGHVELLGYAAIELQGRVLGALRLGVAAPAPVTSFLERSGTLLLVLAIGDAMLLMLLGYMVLTRLVVRPLQDVERATARVSAGELEQRITPAGPREVAALASAFNQMTASLAAQREQLIRTEKLASVGQLAAGVAHEIGNPLAAILGYVDILRVDLVEPSKATLAPAERQDILDRVKAETQRIHRIIQDLLEYSRPTREEPAATDMADLLRAAGALLAPQARFRGVTLQIVGEPWPPVLAAPGRLKQVLVNLLLNGADAMEGQGTLSATCVATENGRVQLTIADQGPGVPPGLHRKIFDPFFTTKPPGKGTGLGLSISRSIVESFGGTLELGATPEGEKGARLVVTLVQASATDGTPASAP